MEERNNLIGGFISIMVGSHFLNLAAEGISNIDEPKIRFRNSQRSFHNTLNKCKEVKGNMETKSRYEVISELERDKRNLIIQRDGLNKKLQEKEKELKEIQRDVEDKKEEIKEFKENMEDQKKTYEELIESIDLSLKRFGDNKQNKKS